MAEHVQPRIFEALTPPHESTIIFLHGRGDSGHNVAPSLLFRPVNSDHSEASRSNSSLTFRHLLPRTKFVFPTAAKRRVQVYGDGTKINQWFDMESLAITDLEEEIQIEGIKESTDYILQLIKEEVDAGIPPEKIVIMGISQGCATGAIVTMRYPGTLGGFVGMSGWLPFISQVENMFREGSDTTTVVRHIEKTLGSDKEITEENITEALKTPVFLGHGVLDTKILPRCGERLRDALKSAKFEKVVFVTYSVGHWWCDEELLHIAVWLGMKGFSVNGLRTFIGTDIESLKEQALSHSDS
ncbi:hypothetical protein TWF281_005449 [Arthrobotrys megalospora]